jgi:hypothetical protein
VRPLRRPPSRPAGLAARVLAAGLVLLASLPSSTGAQTADPAAVAADFASRLGGALLEGPVQQDGLWHPDARDSTARELDLRTASMFRWSDVAVDVERASFHGRDVVAELTLQARAEWESSAWGVASALWPLQCDENRERNRVMRREAWRLTPVDGEWKATERVRLRPFEIVDLHVDARVFPGQDALLVDATFYVRSRLEGLESARFLLDRRAAIYRLTVDGEPVAVVRGGELGALGLDGFTPEVESSFAFPRPLAAGEEALIRFRIRSPLVHLESDGVVTTLPLASGAFRIRAWMPIFDPAHAAGGEVEAVQIQRGWEVHWPTDAFVENTFSPFREVIELVPVDASFEEERGIRIAYGHFSDDPSRDLDFILARPGVEIPRVDWAARMGDALPVPDLGPGWYRRGPEEPRVFRWASLPRPEGATTSVLDPHPRSRRALVEPLLDAAGYSSRDLASELADLLPVDLDLLDELFDDGERDAEAGNEAQGER